MNLLQKMALVKEAGDVFVSLQEDGTIAKIEKLLADNANATVKEVEDIITAEAASNPKLADLISKVEALKG